MAARTGGSGQDPSCTDPIPNRVTRPPCLRKDPRILFANIFYSLASDALRRRLLRVKELDLEGTAQKLNTRSGIQRTVWTCRGSMAGQMSARRSWRSAGTSSSPYHFSTTTPFVAATTTENPHALRTRTPCEILVLVNFWRQVPGFPQNSEKNDI